MKIFVAMVSSGDSNHLIKNTKFNLFVSSFLDALSFNGFSSSTEKKQPNFLRIFNSWSFLSLSLIFSLTIPDFSHWAWFAVSWTPHGLLCPCVYVSAGINSPSVNAFYLFGSLIIPQFFKHQLNSVSLSWWSPLPLRKFQEQRLNALLPAMKLKIFVFKCDSTFKRWTSWIDNKVLLYSREKCS